jgi:SAM-dependent methyltransferase
MNSIHKDIDNYYTDKVKAYGTTPQGVDWNGEESQFLRFKKLSKVIKNNNFSIADIGCGYGKYVEYLQNNFKIFDYMGYDLSSLSKTSFAISPRVVIFNASSFGSNYFIVIDREGFC